MTPELVLTVVWAAAASLGWAWQQGRAEKWETVAAGWRKVALRYEAMVAAAMDKEALR